MVELLYANQTCRNPIADEGRARECRVQNASESFTTLRLSRSPQE